MSDERYEDELRIAERAAQWHAVLGRTGEDAANEHERAQFMVWLEESPRHVREFLLHQAWEAQVQDFDEQREISVEEVLANVTGNVVPLAAGDVEGRKVAGDAGARKVAGDTDARKAVAATIPWAVVSRAKWRAASAAAVVLAAVAAWWLYPSYTFSTAIGELRTVELEDGSRIELNTASRVRVAFSGEARDVQLLEGEALFKVEPDRARPFRVRSGASVIQAVGTQFTVNRRPLATVVAVIEGSVRVYAQASGERGAASGASAKDRDILAAGEQARIGEGGEIQKREPLDGTTASAWRRRRLVFREDALVDIAAEFNRYNRGTRIVVEGETARTRRYGGIFDADDPESIVRFVAQDQGLAIDRSGRRIVIRSK